MKIFTSTKLAALAFVLSLLTVGGNALATPSGTNFSSILSGLDVASIVAGILAACALIALVGFSKWGGKKLAKLFGG